MSLPVFTDRRMIAHDPGPGHPERPARLSAVLDALADHPAVDWRTPRPATEEELDRVHDPAYVRAVLETAGTPARLDPDTVTSEASVGAALLAAGAARDAALTALDGPVCRAMALVRPPGHHAEHDRAMGFCLFNNVAVAAAAALARDDVARVAIVDWDVHHGNGTQHLFDDRADVLFYSSHRGFGFYPGSGAASERGRGPGHGTTLNVPLHAGAGDDELLDAMHRVLAPAMAAFAPDLVLVSAGFDAHVDDPLGGLAVTDGGYAAAARLVRSLADQHASGRVALVLEGGYDLGALARGVRACVDALA